ncbi:MAG: hypothetical protein ACTH1D_01955 [Mycobacteriaceae bacterium]|uniref:hypothetical protein n=1 Tax=Corynebacterium sp. TaxID=1720 RepID=UPI003F97D33B
MVERETERERDLKAQIRRLKAETAIAANNHTNDILPRWVYEDAGAGVPDNATDELQIMPKKRSWQRYRISRSSRA